MRVLLFIIPLISCSPQLTQLASEFSGNIVCLNSLQRELRSAYSDCDYKRDCFDDRAKSFIEKQACTEKLSGECGFVSVKECINVGYRVMDTISGYVLQSGQPDATASRVPEYPLNSNPYVPPKKTVPATPKKAVKDMTSTERKNFLAMIAADPEKAENIRGVHLDIFKEIFGKTSSTAIVAEVNKSIKSGKTFPEVALEEGNDVALELLHDYFGDLCNDDSKYEKCIFKNYYCRLNLDEDSEVGYFDYDFFEGMLDDILSNERKTSGAPSWWESGIDAEDLDSWQTNPHRVCLFMKP